MHYNAPRRVAIIGGLRIPFCRAHTKYAQLSNQDMLTAVLGGMVDKFQLNGVALGDVLAGAVIKHSRDWNLAREAVLGSGLAPETPACDLQRACGTSLEAAIQIGNKIALGQIDAGIAAGTDSISDTPIVYPDGYRQVLLQSFRGRSPWAKIMPWFGLRPKHFKPELPGVTEPRTGLSMGQSTEITAKDWQITRGAQDELAYESHRRTAAAYDEGFYADLIMPLKGVTEDNNSRRDTTVENLATLQPVFDRGKAGTMTAGRTVR